MCGQRLPREGEAEFLCRRAVAGNRVRSSAGVLTQSGAWLDAVSVTRAAESLTEVLLKAYPCGVLLGCGTWLPCALPRVLMSILLLQGGDKPVGWRRPSAFCLTLDGGVDCVTEFKGERLTHTFPPAYSEHVAL